MPPASSVRRHPTLDALSRAAARHLTTDIRRTLRTQDRYALALAGGSTPERLYELLAAEAAGPLPWPQLHLFWGDERFVPPDHPKSNAHLAARILTDPAPIPPSNIHPIPTQTDRPETAAAQYSNTLQQHVPDRSHTFDTALLGLGADGHTASLFPETGTPEERRTDKAWVRAVSAPPRHDIASRISCTLPVLNGARQAVFLVSGARKQDALTAALHRTAPDLPAAQVRPRDALHWFVDEAALPPSSTASS